MTDNEPTGNEEMDGSVPTGSHAGGTTPDTSQEDVNPDEQPLTTGQFRKILSELGANNTDAEPADDAVGSTDDEEDDDPYAAYNPNKIADKAAAIATERAQRILTQQIQSQATFRRTAMAECAKELSGFEVPMDLVSDAIEKVISTYPDSGTLEKLAQSKQYMNLIHAEIGRLALAGNLSKREVKSPEDLTPTSSTRSNLGSDNVDEFRRLFGKKPSAAIIDQVRSMGSK